MYKNALGASVVSCLRNVCFDASVCVEKRRFAVLSMSSFFCGCVCLFVVSDARAAFVVDTEQPPNINHPSLSIFVN